MSQQRFFAKNEAKHMFRPNLSIVFTTVLISGGFVATAGAQHTVNRGHSAGSFVPGHFYGGANGLSAPAYVSPYRNLPNHANPSLNNIQRQERSELSRQETFAREEAIEAARARSYGLRHPGYYGFGRYLAPYAYGVPYGYYGYPYAYGIDPFVYGGYGYYGRPYYYGYLSGVPYITNNNYSPSYYYNYNTLPSSTGAVTTVPDASTPALNDTDSPVLDIDQAKALLVKAETALSQGEYQTAIKDAGQAAYELHEDSTLHEVLWLALMGISDYRGAAIEAHAVAHFGGTPSWNDVAMKYENPNAFSEQMTKLERFVQRNQDSDFAAFLLGYNYLALGHRDAARQWLDAAHKMDPQDLICTKLAASLASDPSGIVKPAPGLLPGAKP